jgi:SAM-dependent methyltransferase
LHGATKAGLVGELVSHRRVATPSNPASRLQVALLLRGPRLAEDQRELDHWWQVLYQKHHLVEIIAPHEPSLDKRDGVDWDDLSDASAAAIDDLSAPEHLGLARVLTDLAPARLLDIGCGSGACLDLLRAMLPGVNLAGLDISQDQIRRARERLGSSVPVIQGDARQRVGRPASYEACLLRCLGRTMADPAERRQMITTAVEALVPGGTLLITAATGLPFGAEVLEQAGLWRIRTAMAVEGRLLPCLVGRRPGDHRHAPS